MRIALVDVDGTLVDSNYQQVLAWFRAFRRVDLTLPLRRIHRHIGMGGDQLVPALAGDEVEEQHGGTLRDAWEEEFAPLLPEVAAVDGAHDLLAGLREVGTCVVLASSGKPDHVDAFLDLIDAREIVDAWTTSDDVERTKPHPDLLKVALSRLGQDEVGDDADVVVIGDSTWDCVAAKRLGASKAMRYAGRSCARRAALPQRSPTSSHR